jgi:hypothetical protein
MSNESGLPKIDGLADVAQDIIQDKGQPQNTAPQAQPAPLNDGGQAIDDPDLQGILKTFTDPTGKVRMADVLKSYKEIQGYTTRTAQENAELKAKLQEQAEIMQFQPPPIRQQGPVDFNQMFIENPEQAISLKAMEIANTQRISEVLQEESMAKPQEFNERMGYVKMLSQNPQYAGLAQTPKGVKKLFEIADKTRTSNMQRNAKEALHVLLGEDIDIEKFKNLVKKDKADNQQINPQPNLNLNAYMPDASTSTRTGADNNLQANDLEIRKQEAFKNGDAKGVAGALLRQALFK